MLGDPLWCAKKMENFNKVLEISPTRPRNDPGLAAPNEIAIGDLTLQTPVKVLEDTPLVS